jgi:hypothetical protein
MKRAEATRRLEALLQRLTAQGRYARLVQSLWVFGGYAQGRSEVADIDVDIEYVPDDKFGQEEERAMWQHSSPYPAFRRELFSNQRIFDIHWNERAELAREFDDFIEIYQRGDTLDDARARLHAIAQDPSASRAPRDPVVAELTDLDDWLPRPWRNEVSQLVETGELAIERASLSDKLPRDSETRLDIEFCWDERNPKRRAAFAAAAYLEARGISPLIADRADPALISEDQTVAVSFAPYDLPQTLHFLESRGDLWMQVGPLSRSRPLVALLVTATKRGT